jgi:molybdopterin-guanine dinucleotide biosynthesis protein B
MNVYQVVGYKDTGKTTLICRLVKALAEQGYRVGTVKHDAHQFEVDQPGTDSWKHREAGAQITAITSPNRTAFMEERSATLDELLNHMEGMDFVLIEGFKTENYPKLVILKNREDADILDRVKEVIAIVSWEKWRGEPKRPMFHIDDVAGLLGFLIHR